MTNERTSWLDLCQNCSNQILLLFCFQIQKSNKQTFETIEQFWLLDIFKFNVFKANLLKEKKNRK